MKHFLFVLILCLIGTTCFASEFNRFPGPDGEPFQYSSFGSSPTDELICVKGPCMGSEKKTRTPISSYVSSREDLSLGGIPIAPPRFDYYNGKLFSVLIQLKCDIENSTSCLDRIENTLLLDYGMSFDTELAGADTFQVRLFSDGNGTVASLTKNESNGKLIQLAMKIYDLELIEEVRRALNPNYGKN